MMALSIRQPWAWLIIRPDITGEESRLEAYLRGWIKDIENRDWPTRYRGPLLLHASKTMDMVDYNYVRGILAEGSPSFRLPAPELLPKGGIVGKAKVVDCLKASPSRWFKGKYGFKLAEAQPLPFTPWQGMRGLFDVPESALRRAA